MQRYLELLIDDLHKATWNVKSPHEIWEDSGANPDDELELEDISYIEKYIYGKEEPISEITGIEVEKLPPAEKLTEEQQGVLATELEKLLKCFNFYLDFPESYPPHLRYAFILDFWAGEQVAMSFGENHIEFCDMNEENCPFPAYCNTCKEVAEQMKFDEEQFHKTGMDIEVYDVLPSPEEIENFIKQQGIEYTEADNQMPQSEPLELEDFDPSEINGFYDDDGNKINPHSIPVPSLCIICKEYQGDDWEENLLCQMNRNDQRDALVFKCGAYKKK